MRLDQYLSDKGLTDAAFAAIIRGVDRSTVTRWRTGDVCPEAKNQRRIFEVTDGAVTPNDFFDVAPQPAPSSTEAAA